MFKQIFNIETEIPEAVQQVLSVKLAKKYIGYSITNKDGDQLYKLEYYSADSWDAQTLQEFYVSIPAFRHHFYKINICYDFPEATFIPLNTTVSDESGNLLRALYSINKSSGIVSESITEWQLRNLYAVPSVMLNWASTNFPSASYRHENSLLLKQPFGNSANGIAMLSFKSNEFSVVLVQNGKLLLSQSFTYTSPADVIYYLLKISGQFHLNQHEIQLVITGLIDKQSALYKDLANYFIQMECRNAKWEIGNEEIQQHFFTTLNDLALCE